MAEIRILLADECECFRVGLRVLLEQEQDFKVVKETDNIKDVLADLGFLKPDVILVSGSLPGLDFAQLTKEVLIQGLGTKILVMGMLPDDPTLPMMVQEGAAGCFLKCESIEVIKTAILSTAGGEGWISPPIAVFVSSWLLWESEAEKPTSREVNVLYLISKGWTNKQIARELGIGKRTVDLCVENLLSKLNANNRTTAVLEAIRRGWIKLSR
jgi:two-component system response regulator DegU